MSYPAPALDRTGELPALSTRLRRYNAAMETFDPDFVIRRRKPRGRPIARAQEGGRLAFVCERSELTKAGAIPTDDAKASEGGRGGEPEGGNNYLAETPKNPVGAKPGNRNALTHGHYRVDRVALRRKIGDLKRRAAALIAKAEGRP